MAADPKTAAKKINAAFNEKAGGWDKSHNIFYHLSTYNDTDFRKINQESNGHLRAKMRQVMGKGNSQTKLDAQEIALLREIGVQAKKDAARYGIDANVAESLRFASGLAGLKHEEFMQRLVESGGNLRGTDPNEVTRAGPFKFDPESWLYMIKAHGAEHGLKYFADKVTLGSGPGGAVTVDVADPAVLREIMSLRDNPRLSAIMGAEYIANEQSMPQRIAAAGGNAAPDAVVKREQQVLMRLGFDIGLRGADGVKGPLTKAALREFAQMHDVTDPAQLPKKLEAVLAQAMADAKKYSRPDRKIDIREAYALRNAGQAAHVPFEHILEIATAQRSFEEPRPATRTPGHLFHFNDGGKWLKTVAEHGAKHGLGELVRHMTGIKRDKQGHVTAVTIPDPMIRQHILDLRANPRISALMAAEYCKSNPVHLDIAQCYIGEDERKAADAQQLSTFMKSQKKLGFANPKDTPWCAAFVNSALGGAGIRNHDSLWALDFLQYGTGVKPADVKPGDVVVFKNGHVAFVEERYKSGGAHRIKVIGGNQGAAGTGNNGYFVNVKDRSESDVAGYRRPPAAVAVKSQNQPKAARPAI